MASAALVRDLEAIYTFAFFLSNAYERRNRSFGARTRRSPSLTLIVSLPIPVFPPAKLARSTTWSANEVGAHTRDDHNLSGEVRHVSFRLPFARGREVVGLPYFRELDRPHVERERCNKRPNTKLNRHRQAIFMAIEFRDTNPRQNRGASISRPPRLDDALDAYAIRSTGRLCGTGSTPNLGRSPT